MLAWAACPSAPSRTRDKQPRLLPKRLPSPVALKTLADSARSPISAQQVGKPRQQEPNVTKLTCSTGNGAPGAGVQGSPLCTQRSGSPLPCPRLTEQEQAFPESWRQQSPETGPALSIHKSSQQPPLSMENRGTEAP